MKRDVAKALREAAVKCALAFSSVGRECNYAKETFEVHAILPLSDCVAAVRFVKSSGRYALALFYYIAAGSSPGWRYFFVTYQHIVGLEKLGPMLHEIELKNFNLTMNEGAA